ncbi:MAG: hypothetical protein LBD06_02275, partial [Candidatus Accumulibacter sp.]|jgi:IS5 family transposase|nr:hypothetical protein [Accumulibacter sp.]
VTHGQGLIVGARAFPGNPHDGHTLNEQREQAGILLEDAGMKPRQVGVELGFRGVDRENPEVEIIHRGKAKRPSLSRRRWLKRPQAVEPVIGHLKADRRMNRRHLAGQLGDTLHTVLCAAGDNPRWLMRAVLRLGLAGCALLFDRCPGGFPAAPVRRVSFLGESDRKKNFAGATS